MNEIIKSSSGKIQELSKKIHELDISKLTGEQIDTLGKLLYLDKAKEQLSKEIDKNTFDYEKRKVNFLKSFPSENTRKVYKGAFIVLERFLNENGLTVLDMTAENIDRFIISLDSLKKRASQSTKRLYISALSSFFSRLERYGVINRNNFHGAKLPVKKRTRDLKILTDADYKNILGTFKAGEGRGAVKRTPETMQKWKVIFRLLRETGIRISAVKTIKIGENGILTYYSKGKEGRAAVTAGLARELKKFDLAEITEGSIQKALQRACKRAGLPEMNPHTIRHLFAADYYKKTKDIYHLQKLLNHSSIAVTENYLKSIYVIS